MNTHARTHTHVYIYIYTYIYIYMCNGVYIYICVWTITTITTATPWGNSTRTSPLFHWCGPGGKPLLNLRLASASVSCSSCAASWSSRAAGRIEDLLVAMVPRWSEIHCGSGGLSQGGMQDAEFVNFLPWLVLEPSLWKRWKSVGMMKFPIYGK